MKNFINQFIPRNPEQMESFIGMLCGIGILAIVFYLYSI